MNAKLWAEEFMRIFGSKMDKIDEGLMIAWFANAIMKGYDVGCERQAETIRRLEGELQRVNASYDADMQHWQAHLTASEAENFKLAAGQCVVDGGLVGGEGGGAYCTLKVKRKWTTARPAVAGWYWWRKGPGYSNNMVAILYDEPHSEWEARFLGSKGVKIGTLPVNACDGEWQGPLTPGEE